MPLPAGWVIVAGLPTCSSGGPDLGVVTLSSVGGGPVVVYIEDGHVHFVGMCGLYTRAMAPPES